MADFLSVAATIAGGALASVGGMQAVRAFWTARLLGTTGPTPLADIEAGLQEVRGTTLAEGALITPMSGRPGMYWRLLVEQQRRTRWETVLDRRDQVPFWIDDGTGRARLDVTHAEVIIANTSRTRAGVFQFPSAEWTDLTTRLGAADTPPIAPFLRWREEYLEAGDVVTAVGDARREGEGWRIAENQVAFMVSDRDETEVIRHHRRLGQRWLLGVLAGAGIAAWGLWGIL